jgi:photosystem II stability/assembly factor-like uncharacterized protein
MKEQFDFIAEEQENPQIVQELATFYHSNAEDRASLAHIRARLQMQAQKMQSEAKITPFPQGGQYMAAPAVSEASMAKQPAYTCSSRTPLPVATKRVDTTTQSAKRRPNGWRRFLPLVAALLIVTLVLGSFIYILNATRPASPHITTTPVPTTSPSNNASEPASTYMLRAGIHMVNTMAGWGIAAKGQTGDGAPPEVLLHTYDGGKIWQNVSPPAYIGNDVPTVFVLNATTAWFIDSQESISSSLYRTLNGGKTWQQFDLSIATNRLSMRSLTFINENDGRLLAGLGQIPNPTMLYQTHDGGKSWQQIAQTSQMASEPSTLPVQESAYEIIFRDRQHGYLLTTKILTSQKGFKKGQINNVPKLYTTSNGGRTWQDANIPMPGDIIDNFDNIQFLHSFKDADVFAMTVLVRRSDGTSISHGYFYSRSSANNTWSISTPLPLRLAAVSNIQMLDEQHALSLDTTIAHFVLQNGAWQQKAGYPYDKFGQTVFSFVDDEHGWALVKASTNPEVRADDKIELQTTDDGGKTWIKQHITLPPGILWIL